MTAPNWTSETAVIVCAGSSLTDDQLVIVQASTAKTIAVNTGFLYLPGADVFFGSDYMFFKVHFPRMKTQGLASRCWTTDSSAAERYQINRVRGGNREGLGTTVCHTGSGNSGTIAINAAFLWGARKILMLGFDMKLGPDGERHRHGNHEKPLTQVQLFDEWIFKGKRIAEDLKQHGCDAVNCTPGSAWPWFRRSTLEAELA